MDHEGWLKQAKREAKQLEPKMSLGLAVEPLSFVRGKQINMASHRRQVGTRFCAPMPSGGKATGKGIDAETQVALNPPMGSNHSVYVGDLALEHAIATVESKCEVGILDTFESKHAVWDAALQFSAWMELTQHAKKSGALVPSLNVWIGTEYFAQIAKLRVVRHMANLWCDQENISGTCLIRAWGNPSSFSLYDVDSNAVRNSIMAQVALVGGADELVLFPHSKDQERLAYHTLLVMREEVSTWHRVHDHAAGSFTIEALGSELWGRVQTVLKQRVEGNETHEAFEQRIQPERRQHWIAETKRVFENQKTWVGVNAFVDLTQVMQEPWIDTHDGALSLVVPGGQTFSPEYMRALVQMHGLTPMESEGQKPEKTGGMQIIARQLAEKRLQPAPVKEGGIPDAS